MAQDKKKDIVTKYLADMVGVVGHVYQAIDKQVKETQDEQDINPLLVRVRDGLEAQTNSLRDHLESLGGKATSPLKELGASVLGVAAGVIDKLRAEEVSKMLRDDYTALGLVNISYTMLITTALACGDRETADLCSRNLTESAGYEMEIGKVISYAVVRDLSDLADLDPNAVQEGQSMYSEAWTSNQSQGGGGGNGKGSSGSGGGGGSKAKSGAKAGAGNGSK
ncbi:MAG: ferritin-like domain-containing protein [Chloroflexota bacterium]|nr:ferritin-like domain-containing protein [Chloroflexota bacterium]